MSCNAYITGKVALVYENVLEFDIDNAMWVRVIDKFFVPLGVVRTTPSKCYLCTVAGNFDLRRESGHGVICICIT